MKPTSASYWERSRFFEYTKKDLHKAVADYTTAIEYAKKEKTATGHSEFPLEMLYRFRGKLYEKLGDPEKAAADFARSKPR